MQNYIIRFFVWLVATYEISQPIPPTNVGTFMDNSCFRKPVSSLELEEVPHNTLVYAGFQSIGLINMHSVATKVLYWIITSLHIPAKLEPPGVSTANGEIVDSLASYLWNQENSFYGTRHMSILWLFHRHIGMLELKPKQWWRHR